MVLVYGNEGWMDPSIPLHFRVKVGLPNALAFAHLKSPPPAPVPVKAAFLRPHKHVESVSYHGTNCSSLPCPQFTSCLIRPCKNPGRALCCDCASKRGLINLTNYYTPVPGNSTLDSSSSFRCFRWEGQEANLIMC